MRNGTPRSSGSESISLREWMSKVHGHDPYAGFPIDQYRLDLQGWWADSPIFDAVISTLKPHRIIEVGSWKGASAVHMADLLARHGIAGEILCVDTWAGGPEVWLRQDRPNYKVPFEFGRPSIYFQFLANVIHGGHTQTIVPLPTDSISASRICAAKSIMADAIYLDAGHEYAHVAADLGAWWPILRTGGIMFGDDYHLLWVGVVRAVHDFADRHGLQVEQPFENKWLVHKP